MGKNKFVLKINKTKYNEGIKQENSPSGVQVSRYFFPKKLVCWTGDVWHYLVGKRCVSL